MIVVDANVIAYRFIVGEKTGLACQVEEKDTDWIVPALWRHEFLNILATSARSGIIDTMKACTVWRSGLHVLGNKEQAVNYEKSLCCAVDFTISAYDAQYITLARTLHCLCITEDARLQRTFPKEAFCMREFLDLKT